MIDSRIRQGWRHSRALGGCAAALLLLTVGCKSTSAGNTTNPSISLKENRSSAGVLQGVKVTGHHFTPNGAVHITALLAASGSDGEPYVEEDIKADAKGDITYDRQPLKCPEPADYGKGSWISLSARDTTSGIADTALFHAGRQPDCGS
jgi:hypothetical protein